MKKIEAYIRHEAFEPIRMDLLALGLPLHLGLRGEGVRPAEGHHRALSRRRADQLPAAQAQARVRGGDERRRDGRRVHPAPRPDGRDRRREGVRHARSSRRTACGRVRAARRRSSRTRTRRPPSTASGCCTEPAPTAGARHPAAHRPHGHGRGRGGGRGARPRVQPRRGRGQGAGRGRRAAARAPSSAATRPRRRAARDYVEARLRGRPAGAGRRRARGPDRVGRRDASARARARRRSAPEAPELLHAVSVAVLTELAMADARVGGRGEPARLVPRAAARRASGVARRRRPPRGALRLRPLARRGGAVRRAAGRAHPPPGRAGRRRGAGRARAARRRRPRLRPDPARADDGGDRADARAARGRPAARRTASVGLSSFHADPADARPRARGGGARPRRRAPRRARPATSATAPTGCCSACSRRTPRRCAPSTTTRSRPLARYDEQYGSDLVGTLEAWFEHDCSTVATAAAIFVHRHTVAYRLERVKELSGLDPLKSEDRERLGLGLKAGRVIAPGR